MGIKSAYYVIALRLGLLPGLGATVAHFGSTAGVVRALLPRDATLDEHLFASILGGVATLSLVLHLTAISAGLNLSFGLIGLGLWNAVAWLLIARQQGSVPPREPPDARLLEKLSIHRLDDRSRRDRYRYR